MVRRAILTAREVGPSYLQIFTPCPTNYKLKSNEVLNLLKKREKAETYATTEFLSTEAEEFLKSVEGGNK